MKSQLGTIVRFEKGRRHVLSFRLQCVHHGDAHFDKVIERPTAGAAGVNHHRQVVGFGQVDELLMSGTNVFAIKAEADRRAALGAQILAHPKEIDGALAGLHDAFHDLQPQVGAAVDQQQTGRFIQHKIHQHLLHGAQHAHGIDDVADAWMTDDDAIVLVLSAQALNGGIVEIIRIRKLPLCNGLHVGVLQRPGAIVPIASPIVLNPAAMAAKVVDRDARQILVEFFTDVGRVYGAKINPQSPAQGFIVILFEAEMSFEPGIDGRIVEIVDRHAIRDRMAEGG
ncbi:MAG: hypothetical protein BWY83_03226 [bacterium ADurb.Bin478]|nr:MAG: hypothetical protein BWY83_03226 [bacterium ADurb.Bin478]